jgi:hypothetical protein
VDEYAQMAVDFFEGRGRFAERDDYLGMEASRIPDLFVDYFNQLDPSGQQAMATTLAQIALGQRAELAEYLPAAARLMVDLAVRSKAGAFAGIQSDLEREFSDRAGLERWSHAVDRTPPAGLDFRGDWHYPLQLWGVLYQLGSPVATEAFDYLLRHADSARFRQALTLARGAYDSKRQ